MTSTGIPELDELLARDRQRNWLVVLLAGFAGLLIVVNVALGAAVVWLSVDERHEVLEHRQRNEIAHSCLLEYMEAQQEWSETQQHWTEQAVGAFRTAIERRALPELPPPIPPAQEETCPDFIDPATGEPIRGHATP